DANVLFRANCPNIDLVVFGKKRAVYVQVKSSEHPASKGYVTVHGTPWDDPQLYECRPIYNKHREDSHYEATLILVLDKEKGGTMNIYLAPPQELEDLARQRGRDYAKRPKRDGKPRKITFRKELPRELLTPWLNAWHLLEQA